MTRLARRHFWDPTGGGYYDTLAGQEDLFVRTKSMSDGVIPCANSVMVTNLIELSERTGQPAYLQEASATLGVLSGRVRRSPVSVALATAGLARLLRDYPDAVPNPRRATGSLR